jgi:phage head maturation protease
MKNSVTIESVKNFLEIPATINSDAVIDRKQFADTLTIGEEEERTVVCKISTDNVDMDGDIVYPMGCDTSVYLNNPVVLFSHRHSELPIGKTTALLVTEHDITAKMKIAPTESGNEIFELVKGGYLRCSSIGFVIKNALIRGQKEFDDFVRTKGLQITNSCNRIITKFVLMENSLVPLPSNTGSLMQAISTKSISVSDKLMKEMELVVKEEPKAEPKVEPKAEVAPEPKTEVKEEPKVAPVAPKVEPPIVLKPDKAIEEETYKPTFVILRAGDYVPKPEEIKSYKSGKIITI